MKHKTSGMVLLTLAFAASAANWKNSSGSTWDGSWGSYQMTVDASNAGRIVKFQYDSLDVIRPGSDQGALFWPAPQALWSVEFKSSWPAPVAFDGSAYTASTDSNGAVLVLVGPVDANTKLRVTKRFSYDSVADKMVLTYTTTNTATDSARLFAPWEISRGFSGSLLFFPKATQFKFVNTRSDLAPDLPLTREDSSLGWYNDANNNSKYQSNKFFRDGGEGWLAQLKDSLLFVKQYPDVDSLHFAPGESDVEGYTSSNPSQNTFYIENEVLGPWTKISVGDSLRWIVRWGCAILPKTANLSVGSADLVKAARALVATKPTSVQSVRPRLLQKGRPIFVDARGRLLSKSDRRLQAGSLGVLPVP